MTPLPAGPEPDAVLIGPDNSKALVADFETSTVTAIDLSTMTVRKIIPVAGNPTGIALWKSTMIAYVSGGNSVTPLDLNDLDAGTPLPVGTTAQGLALADNGRTAWVCGGNATLVPVNLVSGAIGRAVDVGGQPTAVVIPAPPTTRTPPGAGS
jgi:YVTN family beta-propeller protein